jgi:hypothetical protein
MGQFGMGQYGPQEESFAASAEKLRDALRVVATLVGVIAIVVGFFFATRLFGTLHSGLTKPEKFNSTIDKWESILGGEELDLVVGGKNYPLARPLAVALLGGGTFVLVWIVLGIMITGAKIVSVTTSDTEAIKRILRHAFGAEMKLPPGRGPEEKSRS